MSKIVLIKRGSKSDWISCQSITSNIEKAYQASFDKADIEVRYLNPEDDQFAQWLLAKELSTLKADIIAFIDHQPHPASLLLSLKELVRKMPRLIFHIFGDYTLQTSNWLSLQEILKKTPVDFIVASQKQKELLQNLMKGKKDLIKVIPFPIDTSFFNFAKTEKSKKTCYFYSGRLSTQKNILELVTYFHQFNKNIDSNSKLVIAGPVDDLGIPFLGKDLHSGSYGHSLEKHVSKINNPNITILRNQNHEQLRDLYRQADFYVNLSTHNDEDYGMAPAEALCCGLPCILSDWGGFSGFKNLGAVKYIPVAEKNARILPMGDKFIGELTSAQGELSTSEEREKISKLAMKKLSIENYTSELKKLIETDSKLYFESFTREMEMISSSHKINKNAPFFKGANGSYSELFYKIYKPYFN